MAGPVEAWATQARGAQTAGRSAAALTVAAGWRLEIEEERGGIFFPNFLRWRT